MPTQPPRAAAPHFIPASVDTYKVLLANAFHPFVLPGAANTPRRRVEGFIVKTAGDCVLLGNFGSTFLAGKKLKNQ